MFKGITNSGFNYEFDSEALNNMEFVDALAECDENGIAFTKVVNMLLDAEQKKALYDHIRDGKGRVPIDALATEIAEMLEASSKN